MEGCRWEGQNLQLKEVQHLKKKKKNEEEKKEEEEKKKEEEKEKKKKKKCQPIKKKHF